MRKSKKVFLIVGLPLLAFSIFIMAIYYVIHIVWLLTVAGVFLLATYRKKRKYISLTKLGLVLFLYFVFVCVNPLYWPQQISRHLNRGSLITPNAQCIIDLNASFVASASYNGPYNRSTLQGQMNELSDVQDFIYNPGYNPNDWIDYVYDFFQYPGVFDHIPTPEEVLANRMDDCDGIAVVTVSLLVRLGYEAYVAESDSHWWTYVKIYGEDLNGSLRGRTYTVIYLNWWESIGDPYVIFNQTAVFFMQSLITSWFDQMTDPYYTEIVQDYALNPEDKSGITPLLEMPLFLAILPFALFLLGFVFSYGIGFPRNYQTKKKHPINALFAAAVIAAILFILVFLPANLLSFGNIILIGGLGLLAFVLERDYFVKMIWKDEKF